MDATDAPPPPVVNRARAGRGGVRSRQSRARRAGGGGLDDLLHDLTQVVVGLVDLDLPLRPGAVAQQVVDALEDSATEPSSCAWGRNRSRRRWARSPCAHAGAGARQIDERRRRGRGAQPATCSRRASATGSPSARRRRRSARRAPSPSPGSARRARACARSASGCRRRGSRPFPVPDAGARRTRGRCSPPSPRLPVMKSIWSEYPCPMSPYRGRRRRAGTRGRSACAWSAGRSRPRARTAS